MYPSINLSVHPSTHLITQQFFVEILPCSRYCVVNESEGRNLSSSKHYWYIGIYVCACIYVCVYTCVHRHMYVCMYVYVYVCYIYTCTHTHNMHFLFLKLATSVVPKAQVPNHLLQHFFLFVFLALG